MGRYRVLIKPSAVKEIEAIGRKKDRQRIVGRIKRLADDPRPADCQKLSGRDLYRVRQGNFRIVYSIEDDRLIAIVVKVGHRRDVYRSRS